MSQTVWIWSGTGAFSKILHCYYTIVCGFTVLRTIPQVPLQESLFTKTGAVLSLFFFWCVQSAGSGPGVLIYATRGRALKGKQQRPGKPGPVTITAPAYTYCVCVYAWIRLRYDRKPALWTRPPTPFSLYYGNLLWSHTLLTEVILAHLFATLHLQVVAYLAYKLLAVKNKLYQY